MKLYSGFIKLLVYAKTVFIVGLLIVFLRIVFIHNSIHDTKMSREIEDIHLNLLRCYKTVVRITLFTTNYIKKLMIIE